MEIIICWAAGSFIIGFIIGNISAKVLNPCVKCIEYEHRELVRKYLKDAP